MAYATPSDVSAELGGYSLTSATTPTSTVVEGWIADAEDEVELLTGQVYSTTAIASTAWEYHDYDGSGVIKLDNYPVQSVTLLQYEENGEGATTESWVTLVGPGRTATDNFQLYTDLGVLKLTPNSTGNSPLIGHKNIRVAYVHGHTSVPRNVKQLVTLLAAKRLIMSVANNSGTTGGGSISVGAISISDPTNYVYNHMTRINEEIKRLQESVVGRLRVVNYDARLYE